MLIHFCSSVYVTVRHKVNFYASNRTKNNSPTSHSYHLRQHDQLLLSLIPFLLIREEALGTSWKSFSWQYKWNSHVCSCVFHKFLFRKNSKMRFLWHCNDWKIDCDCDMLNWNTETLQPAYAFNFMELCVHQMKYFFLNIYFYKYNAIFFANTMVG